MPTCIKSNIPTSFGYYNMAFESMLQRQAEAHHPAYLHIKKFKSMNLEVRKTNLEFWSYIPLQPPYYGLLG